MIRILNKISRNKLLALFSCLLFIFFAQTNIISPVSEARANIWSDNEWSSSSPEDQGVDSSTLSGMMDYISETELRIDSILVIRNGYIIYEKYLRGAFQEYKHAVWSVTKSIISCLTGIAYQEGFIKNLEDTILEFFPDKEILNYDSRKENITIKNLLTMSNGQEWSDDTHFTPFINAVDQVAHVLGLPLLTDPGSEFNYDTGATHLLSAILQNVTEDTSENFAKTYLFDKIGISRYYWEKDNQNIPFGGHGIYMTPRDMARFGLLYLHNGSWNDEQIVSEEWIANSTNSYWNLGDGRHYGYSWWLKPYQGFYSARGYGGQIIYVIPELNIVTVITADLPPETFDTDHLIVHFILRAIRETEETVLLFILPIITVFLVSVRKRVLKKHHE